MASGRRGRPRTEPVQEGPADFMDTMREMAHAMREQAAAAPQMMDQLGRPPKASHGGNPHGPGADLDYLKFAEFRKANPPNFQGAYDPDKADEWIKADFCHLYARSRRRILVERRTKTIQRISDKSHLDGVKRCFLPKVLSCLSLKCQGT